MTATVDQELRDRSQSWMEAIQRKDLDALDAILGEEYTYTASGQGRWSRQSWLDTVAIYDIHRFEIRDIDVRRYGDVAIVLGEYWQEATVRGEPRSGEFQITDVWVMRDGRWQVVARSSIYPAVHARDDVQTEPSQG